MLSPLRILMVSEFFPPILGGVERHVFDLSAALAARGHQVRVVTLGWKGMPAGGSLDGFQVSRIAGVFQRLKYIYGDAGLRFHPPLADPLLVRRLAAVIRAFRPDVVHCHGQVLYSLLRVKRKLPFPLLVTLHDYAAICPKRILVTGEGTCRRPFTRDCYACAGETLGYAKGRAASWFVRRRRPDLARVDRFLAVSTSVRDVHCRHLELPADRFVVIPNFPGAAHAAGPGIWPDNFIVYVGTFSAAKGVPVLLEAFARINRPDVKLVLIGITYGASLPVPARENIVVLENQSHGVVMEAWRRSLFGVVPSVCPEACPTVALEAMSCGRALVASDIGGLADIVVPGETGVLVPPGDVDALAQAVAGLLGDRDRAVRLGERGRERFRQVFSPDRVVSRIEAAYLAVRQGRAD